MNAPATPPGDQDHGAGAPPARGRDLRELSDILPDLIDALADAVVVVDRDRRIIATNRRHDAIFAGRRVDLFGSACTEAKHVGAAREVGREPCAACEVFETRTAQRRLRQIPDPSGAVRRYEATFTPIFAGDQVKHVVELWRDITDRSQLEVQLSHSERLASVGILAAGVAHEINNPLASIMAGVDGLKRWLGRGRFDAGEVAEAAETLGLLEREIERCRGTTEKLMLLGRSFDTKPSWVDLNHAVRDTVELLRYELRHHDIEAHLELDPELPQIWAREAGMRGIAMNLMINAVQAMGAGGRLTAITRRGPEHVTLAIEDTGSGIPPEHLERIWDAFFTTKPVGQGTGLGLSITHRVVTRHGGRIAVTSEPGRGARFEVELPIQGTGGDE